MHRPFRRPKRASSRTRVHHAYDLETVAIAAGPIPEPRYVSVSIDGNVHGWPVNTFTELHDVLVAHFLVDEHVNSSFVGYNSNRFDAYLVAQALKADQNYLIEPWLARGHQLRGMRISDTENPKRFWIFSDAMAMTGFTGNLQSFLDAFAPGERKGEIDVINFNASNPLHVEYNHNDTATLQRALDNVDELFRDVTGMTAQNTIGKLAIKAFQRNLPEGVLVWPAPRSARDGLNIAKRGGYVYCRGRYSGPIWKYDINQSYASQMRKPLPSGRCMETFHEIPELLGLYHVTLSYPYEDGAPVPFYCRSTDWSTIGLTDGSSPRETWIVSPEVEHLRAYGWNVEIHDGWVWTDRFDMSEWVDGLQAARIAAGPKTPKGLAIKSVGNNAFGKTFEEFDGLRLVISDQRPGTEYFRYRDDDPDYDDIWFTIEDVRPADYHRPQLGSFITAYGRLQLMEAANFAPRAFQYADTDCVVFTEDVTWAMDVDPAIYGYWKVEEAGATYSFINKKAYFSHDADPDPKRLNYPRVAHAKGLHVQDLTLRQWHDWYDGTEIPEQQQLQRQNFVTTMADQDMFVPRGRSGCFVLPDADPTITLPIVIDFAAEARRIKREVEREDMKILTMIVNGCGGIAPTANGWEEWRFSIPARFRRKRDGMAADEVASILHSRAPQFGIADESDLYEFMEGLERTKKITRLPMKTLYDEARG